MIAQQGILGRSIPLSVTHSHPDLPNGSRYQSIDCNKKDVCRAGLHVDETLWVIIGVESKKWEEPRKLVLMDVIGEWFTPLAKRPRNAAFKCRVQT